MNSKFSHRIVAIFVSVIMLFTMSPLLTFAGEYDAYEFVVSADNISVQSGDVVILTVTVNGTMDNAYTLQFQIQYNSEEFYISQEQEKAFESGWYSKVLAGEGLGDISQPSGGDQAVSTESSKRIYTVIYYDIMSALTGKQPSFIGEDDDLFGKKTTTAAKLVFTAQKDIEDISDCFIIKEAINGYGDANGTIKDCTDTTLVQLSETIAVQKAINLINAISSPVTYSSKAAIEAARKAYDAITTESLKEQVTNIEVLEAAESVLAERTKKIADVKKLIDDLNGESATFKADIEAAESAYYNDLTDAERATLTGYDAKLQAKWAEYEDRIEAAKVDSLIEAIKTVTLDSLAAIEAAETAWGELTEAQQGYVTKHDALIQARKDYDTIVSNKQAADGVVAVINAIPSTITRENAETARDAINTARISYNGAGDAISKFIPADVLKKLTDAEEEIVLVEAAIVEAESVEELIGGIGEITLDSVIASEEKLTEIAGKLESISDRAKGYIDTDKMTAYIEACSTLADCKSKLSRVQAVIDAIDDLGAADDITLEDKEDIEAAETAFEALGTVLQDRVTNAQTLRDIRTKLDALIKSEADVNNVKKLINEIGEVTLESLAKINAARSAFDKLSTDEQAMIDNYNILSEAEDLYAKLFAAAEQEKADQAAADGVEELIAAIGTVELTDACEALIKAAEGAYAGLLDRQKKLVENYSILTQARADYDILEADKEAVDKVIKAINDIGTVTYDDDCLARIQAAEKAYEDLRGDLKGRVANSDKIDFSKERYAQLEAEDKAVKNVISLIDAIGEVSWTEDSLSKINAARSAYDELKRDDLKAKVENAHVLIEAEKIYTNLKPVFKQEQSIEAYNGKHMTVITNVPEDMTVSDGSGADAVLIKLGDTVYHVFVTDHVVSEADIVLKPGTPVAHELGNINGQGGITALDALMACQYAARTEEAIKAFAEDPLAFVRADVNGTGTITALDALMIANKAAGLKEVEFTLLVGATQNAQ